MASNNEERTYFVICEDNCKFEGMTKEQIINAIAEATGATPESIDVDAAFITKIKEMNANKNLKFWIGTTAQFEALPSKVQDTLYILTDDDTADSLEALYTELNAAIAGIQESLTGLQDGLFVVKNAQNATNAANATNATNAANSALLKANGTYLENAVGVTDFAVELDGNCLYLITTYIYRGVNLEETNYTFILHVKPYKQGYTSVSSFSNLSTLSTINGCRYIRYNKKANNEGSILKCFRNDNGTDTAENIGAIKYVKLCEII